MVEPTQAGEGGVGYSWFTIELDTSGTETPPDERPPYVPIPGPAPGLRTEGQRGTDKFDGKYTVVRSTVDRFHGRITPVAGSIFEGAYRVISSSEQHFSASYRASTVKVKRRREEEEMLFLMDDD